jgi:hypothetical protein
MRNRSKLNEFDARGYRYFVRTQTSGIRRQVIQRACAVAE